MQEELRKTVAAMLGEGRGISYIFHRSNPLLIRITERENCIFVLGRIRMGERYVQDWIYLATGRRIFAGDMQSWYEILEETCPRPAPS